MKEEVIRDAVWEKCLTDALKFYRLQEVDARCYKLADATWRTKMSYKKLKDKKESRRAVLIDQSPEPVINQRASGAVLCVATTISGKPCSFRAVCGMFCRKHKVSENVAIGKKINVT
jgi:hypothetical protein